MPNLFKFSNTKEVPYGVRILTFATGVRWFGWGLGETLLPIFLYSFAKGYAGTGLLGSVYDLAFILTLPIAGVAGDIFPATSLIILGLALYTIIGAGYFLAGITGLAIFVVIARFTNGVTYGLDYVGRQTYFRRHVESNKLASAFGYFDMIANLWWIIAAVASIFLIKYFSIPFLLLMITPTSLIALFIVWRFKLKHPEKIHPVKALNMRGAYSQFVKEIKRWNWPLRYLAIFNFCITLAWTVTALFLPIDIYIQGGDLVEVIFIGILFAIPPLFGWVLGRFLDNKGVKVFTSSIFALALLLLSLAYVDAFWLRVLIVTGIGIVLEVLSLGTNELVTLYSQPEHFGRIGGVMESIVDLGSLIGPVAFGILIDLQGIKLSFFYLAILVAILAIFFYRIKGIKIGGRGLHAQVIRD